MAVGPVRSNIGVAGVTRAKTGGPARGGPRCALVRIPLQWCARGGWRSMEQMGGWLVRPSQWVVVESRGLIIQVCLY